MKTMILPKLIYKLNHVTTKRSRYLDPWFCSSSVFAHFYDRSLVFPD